VSPAKTAELIEVPFGLWIQMGPGNHVYDGDPDPHGKGQFLGKGVPIYSLGTFWHELCKNGSTVQFTVWVVDSGEPKEARVQMYSPGGANVPGDTAMGSEKWLNRSICRLDC